MEKENKTMWEKMKSFAKSKLGIGLVVATTSMGLGAQEVDAAKAPPPKPHHQMTMMQQQKKAFNDRVQVKKTHKEVKRPHARLQRTDKKEIRKMKPNMPTIRKIIKHAKPIVIHIGGKSEEKLDISKLKKNRKRSLPNIPGASIEEKVKVSELNKIKGELHRKKIEAMYEKDQVAVEKLNREIRAVDIQQSILLHEIRARQQDNDMER